MWKLSERNGKGIKILGRRWHVFNQKDFSACLKLPLCKIFNGTLPVYHWLSRVSNWLWVLFRYIYEDLKKRHTSQRPSLYSLTILNFRLKQIYEYHVERCLIQRRGSRKDNFNPISFHTFLIINDITARKPSSQCRWKTDICEESKRLKWGTDTNVSRCNKSLRISSWPF